MPDASLAIPFLDDELEDGAVADANASTVGSEMRLESISDALGDVPEFEDIHSLARTAVEDLDADEASAFIDSAERAEASSLQGRRADNFEMLTASAALDPYESSLEEGTNDAPPGIDESGISGPSEDQLMESLEIESLDGEASDEVSLIDLDEFLEIDVDEIEESVLSMKTL